MADPVRATKLDPSNAFDPNTDFLMAVKGDASGARSGPYLIPGVSVTVGSAVTGGDGTGGGTTPPPSGGITKVFNRDGPEIAAQTSDYDAVQIDYDATTSGLAADNVQTAIDAVAALRETLPVPGSDGDILTATGGVWSSQPPAVESFFGRSGAVDALTGDYHADHIALQRETAPGSGVFVDTTNRFVTAAQVAKLTALSEELQLPDPDAETAGHVLTVVDTGGTKTWEAAAPTGGTGGGGGAVVLAASALLRPDPSSPPSWLYSGGTGYWEASNSGTQALFFEIDYWPGGDTVTLGVTITCAATSGTVQFAAQAAAVTPDSAELWDRTFPTAATGSVTVADAVKKIKRASVTLTGMDGVAAGDWVRVKLWRDNTVGSNAAGAVQIRGVDVRFETAS